jgi:hypothetical protein
MGSGDTPNLHATTSDDLNLDAAKVALINCITQSNDAALKGRVADLSQQPHEVIFTAHPNQPWYEFGDNCRILIYEKQWWVRVIHDDGQPWNYDGQFKRGANGKWEAVIQGITGDAFHDPSRIAH